MGLVYIFLRSLYDKLPKSPSVASTCGNYSHTDSLSIYIWPFEVAQKLCLRKVTSDKSHFYKKKYP